MRAREFVRESQVGKMPSELHHAAKELVKFRDDGWDRTYALNRAMMAAAMHDGKSTGTVDMDSASFADRFNTAHPYTKEESNMIRGALKTIGGVHKDIMPHSPSEEMPDTNTASPVASFKGYKRK